MTSASLDLNSVQNQAGNKRVAGGDNFPGGEFSWKSRATSRLEARQALGVQGGKAGQSGLIAEVKACFQISPE